MTAENVFDGPPTCVPSGAGFQGKHCLHDVGHGETRCCGACGGAFTDPTTKGLVMPEGFSYRMGFWHAEPGPLWPQVRSEMVAAHTAGQVTA